MKKVKILLLNPFKDINSYEHRPMQEAQFFKESGYDTEVIIMQRKVTGRGIYQNAIQGIPITHFLCKSEGMEQLLLQNRFVALFKPLIYLKWYFEFVLWLRRELRREQGCCILAHNIEMAFAMILASKSKKDRRVFVMRELYEGQVTNRIKKFVIQRLSRFIQSRSRFLVHVVPYQREVTSKKNINKIIYIPNYPAKENYYGITKVESDKLRINYIGCVRDEKSLKMLMDAVQGFDDVVVGIHGEGEAYNYLRSIEDDYNNVHVTGYYDYRTQTKKLFAETDIVYCAYDLDVQNWRIAYPIKLYEAIATNTPVLLCNGMAPAKFVEENDYGFVFNYNLESLRECINAIRKDRKKLEQKINTMKSKKNVYFWENVVTKYNQIMME